MIIVVSGSRELKDPAPVAVALDHFSGAGKNVTLYHGDCRGADKLAAEYGLARGWRVIAVPAEWGLGNDAGPLRSAAMLIRAKRLSMVEGRPIALVAFPGPKSRGTPKAIALAKLLNIKTHEQPVTS